MNEQIIKTIETSAQSALEGTKAFPEIVSDLMDVGVSRYFIDFARAEQTCYLKNGESHRISIWMPTEPISDEFIQHELLSAIKASQNDRQNFQDFLKRAFAAGCIGYTAYLDGKRVVYVGKNGEEHIEHFPS